METSRSVIELPSPRSAVVNSRGSKTAILTYMKRAGRSHQLTTLVDRNKNADSIDTRRQEPAGFRQHLSGSAGMRARESQQEKNNERSEKTLLVP